MNDIKWFYCFNADSGDFFEEIEHDIPESPSHDELDAIAPGASCQVRLHRWW